MSKTNKLRRARQLSKNTKGVNAGRDTGQKSSVPSRQMAPSWLVSGDKKKKMKKGNSKQEE